MGNVIEYLGLKILEKMIGINHWPIDITILLKKYIIPESINPPVHKIIKSSWNKLFAEIGKEDRSKWEEIFEHEDNYSQMIKWVFTFENKQEPQISDWTRENAPNPEKLMGIFRRLNQLIQVNKVRYFDINFLNLISVLRSIEERRIKDHIEIKNILNRARPLENILPKYETPVDIDSISNVPQVQREEYIRQIIQLYGKRFRAEIAQFLGCFQTPESLQEDIYDIIADIEGEQDNNIYFTTREIDEGYREVTSAIVFSCSRKRNFAFIWYVFGKNLHPSPIPELFKKCFEDLFIDRCKDGLLFEQINQNNRTRSLGRPTLYIRYLKELNPTKTFYLYEIDCNYEMPACYNNTCQRWDKTPSFLFFITERQLGDKIDKEEAKDILEFIHDSYKYDDDAKHREYNNYIDECNEVMRITIDKKSTVRLICLGNTETGHIDIMNWHNARANMNL